MFALKFSILEFEGNSSFRQVVSKSIKLSTGDKRDLLKREEGFFSISYTYPSFSF